MNWKLIVIGFIFTLASSCTSLMVQNPALNDLSGTWESTGSISYLMLSVSEKETGLLAIVFDKNTIIIYKIDSFQSLEQGFKIRFVDINGKQKPILLEGNIILGRLALKDPSVLNEILWFIKSNDLSKYKIIATDEINRHQ